METLSITQTALKLIPIVEVIRLTSLKKTSIYQLVRAHELHIVKLGRKTVFLEAEIFSWIEKQVADSTKVKAPA
jgi:predicted DNA-binding transcriptional regulator AlpA